MKRIGVGGQASVVRLERAIDHPKRLGLRHGPHDGC